MRQLSVTVQTARLSRGSIPSELRRSAKLRQNPPRCPVDSKSDGFVVESVWVVVEGDVKSLGYLVVTTSPRFVPGSDVVGW